VPLLWPPALNRGGKCSRRELRRRSARSKHGQPPGLIARLIFSYFHNLLMLGRRCSPVVAAANLAQRVRGLSGIAPPARHGKQNCTRNPSHGQRQREAANTGQGAALGAAGHAPGGAWSSSEPCAGEGGPHDNGQAHAGDFSSAHAWPHSLRRE
jgi:hypothetical protein